VPKRERHEVLQRRAVGVAASCRASVSPFVYRLAQEELLAGLIGNDTDGVTIEIEGPPPRSTTSSPVSAPKLRPLPALTP